MKPCNSIVIALCTAFAFATGAATASETAQVPDTAAAKAAAGMISKVERAITRYVAACASDRAQDLNGVMTEDARIEFALEEPGTYLSIDAGSLAGHCNADSGDSPQISHLWIFPTLDANALFVQYDLGGSAGTRPEQQLVLVEMRGDRIARLLNLGSSQSRE